MDDKPRYSRISDILELIALMHYFLVINPIVHLYKISGSYLNLFQKYQTYNGKIDKIYFFCNIFAYDLLNILNMSKMFGHQWKLENLERYQLNSFCIHHQFTQKPIFPLMRWRPTDLVITALLQRVMHPLPLFVKRMGWCIGSDAIDKNGRYFACDLVKGEFLPPFGKGEIADVVFSCPPQEYIGEGFNGRNFRAPRYKNTVMAIFQGDEANGIQSVSVTNPQTLLKVREAFENGYQRKLTFSESMAYDLQRREGLDSGKCYCFRIRTERDEAGRIKSSVFGKIYGDPAFLLNGGDRWTQKVGGIAFLYYLNPTPNDRNLEWDRKNNLCDKPGKLEMIVNHMPTLLP